MGAIAMMIVGGYLLAGSATALAFVIYGATRVQPAPLTLGARILLLPGATALWPFVLIRWLRTRAAP